MTGPLRNDHFSATAGYRRVTYSIFLKNWVGVVQFLTVAWLFSLKQWHFQDYELNAWTIQWYVCFYSKLLLRMFKYSRGGINWAKSLGAHISHSKACKPINLGPKWKPLISSFQNCPWIWDLNLNCLSYGLEKERNLNLKNAQNESSLLKLSW